MYETRDVVIAEDVIHSVAAPICSLNVTLMSSDVNQLPMRFGLLNN